MIQEVFNSSTPVEADHVDKVVAEDLHQEDTKVEAVKVTGIVRINQLCQRTNLLGRKTLEPEAIQPLSKDDKQEPQALSVNQTPPESDPGDVAPGRLQCNDIP